MSNYFSYFLALFIFILGIDAKLHSFERFKRQANLLGQVGAPIGQDAHEPIGFMDIGRILMDPNELHKRLHRMSSPPSASQNVAHDMPMMNLLQRNEPGVRSGPKQPFLFHVAQDFFTAAINFLFQFMM